MAAAVGYRASLVGARNGRKCLRSRNGGRAERVDGMLARTLVRSARGVAGRARQHATRLLAQAGKENAALSIVASEKIDAEVRPLCVLLGNPTFRKRHCSCAAGSDP